MIIRLCRSRTMLTESCERFRRTITIRLLCRPAGLIGHKTSWRCSPGGKKTATSLSFVLLVSSLFSVLQATDPCNAVELEHSFFDIVNVKEKFHLARRMAELGNVSLKIFLHLFREIAQTQTAHLVIPFDDRLGIFLCCVLAYP